MLSGTSLAVLADSGSPTICVIVPNKINREIEITGFLIRFRKGLENCLVTLSIANRVTLIEGVCTLAGIGQQSDGPVFDRIRLTGEKPRLTGSENLELKLQTYSQAVEARDINVLLFVEEV